MLRAFPKSRCVIARRSLPKQSPTSELEIASQKALAMTDEPTLGTPCPPDFDSAQDRQYNGLDADSRTGLWYRCLT